MAKSNKDLYDSIHRICPRCLDYMYNSTCEGYAVNNIHNKCNHNTINCICGWSGIGHDLVPWKNKYGYKLTYHENQDYNCPFCKINAIVYKNDFDFDDIHYFCLNCERNWHSEGSDY